MRLAILRDNGADEDIPLPSYESAHAAGADIRANLAAADRALGVTLAPGARALIPTGLRMAVPEGHEMQIRPRSGLALKHGIGLVNAPGTIDADYRGPVGVILINHGSNDFIVAHGDRIAQMVLAPVIQALFHETAELDVTARGDAGFGSTGQG